MAVMRGTVVRLEGGLPHVEVKQLGAGYTFGPLETAVAGLEVGERVVVGSVGSLENIVVLGSLTPTAEGYTDAQIDALFGGVTTALNLKADKARQILPGLGLTGGGDLSADRTLTLSFAPSGTSNATQAVRADDSRLSNARTPTAHTHPFTDVTGVITDAQLPDRLDSVRGVLLTDWDTGVENGWYVAAGGAPNGPPVTTQAYMATVTTSTSASTVIQVARGYSSGIYRRTRNAGVWTAWTQEFTTAAELDARYFTETESDARYPARALLASTGASVTWFRVASVNGLNSSNGGNISLLIGGQGNYGQAQRNTELVHFGQRGDNVFTFEAWHFGLNTSAWTWHVKQISTYVFELWAKRPTFDSPAHVTVVGAMNGVATFDSSTTVDPALASAGTAVNVDQIARNAVVRIVHGSNAATARHTWATFVEWVGSVAPTNATANDTWVNTTA